MRHTSTSFRVGLPSYSCRVHEPYTRYLWSPYRHMCVRLWACSSIVHSSVSMQLVYFPVTTKPTACCVTLTNVHHCAARIYHSLKTCSSFRRRWRRKNGTLSMGLGGHLQNYFFCSSLKCKRAHLAEATVICTRIRSQRTLKVIYNIFHGC